MLPGRKYTPEAIGQLLWQRRGLIAATLFLCTFAALCVARLQPDLYQSETLVQVLPQRVPDVFVRSAVTSSVEERLKTITEVIKSRSYLEEVIADLNLYEDELQDEPMTRVVETMRNNIKVEVGAVPGQRRLPNEPVNAFRVSFTYRDKAQALEVTKRLTTRLIEENTRMRGNLAEATNQFLQTQLVEARKNLEAQEKKLEAFRQQHAGRLPSQLESNLQAVQALQLQLNQLTESIARDRDRKLMLERLYADAQAQLEALRRMPVVTPQQGTGETPAATMTAQQRLVAARANLEQLELRLTPEHPDIVRAKRQIRELEQQVEKEAAGAAPSQRPVTQEELQRRAALDERRAEIDSLGRQIKFKEQEQLKLQGQIAQYQGRIEAVPGIESEYIKLTRDYDTLNETYKALLAKSEESKMSANLERRQIGEQFRVLDAPRVSDTPVTLNRLKINLAGVLGGVVLALGLVGFLEFRDSTFRNDAEVLSALSLPVLATVPFVATAADLERARQRKMLVTVASVVMVAVSGVLFWVLELWKYVI